MLRHDAALASGKLTRGGTGGQLTHTEVIMSRLLPSMKACRLQEDQQVGEDRLAELISFLQKIAAVSSGLLSILSALVAVILGYYFGYRPALAEPALSAGPREETRIAD